MQKVSAKIVCDSTNHLNTRLTTFQIRIPLIIQAELNTHRVFSRSYNSSRAIPAKVMRKSADFEPKTWLSNQPGMEGGDELTGFKKHIAIATWRSLTEIDKIGHRVLEWCNLHKQYTNRRLASTLWVDGVITSTDWDNFLELRNHPSAQPEIRNLASQIDRLLTENKPDYLEDGEWHLPYIEVEDLMNYSIEKLRLISAGRCARVSYGFKDIKDSVASDLKRAEKLLNSVPAHVSPCEHIAMAPFNHGDGIEFKSGNFRNWVQFRQIIDSGMPI
jgi:hypothetical protein